MVKQDGFVTFAIFGLSIIFLICIALGVVSAMAPYEGVCAGKFCLQQDGVRWYFGAAALAALVGLLFRARTHGTAIEGVGLVFMGLAVVATQLPPNAITFTGSTTGGEQAATPIQELRLAYNRRLQERALNDDLTADDVEVMMVGERVEVVKFSVPRTARVRVDVAPDGDVGDPEIELYKLGDDFEDRSFVAENDDADSDGYDARIERELSTGDYLLVIKDIADEGGLASDRTFIVSFSNASLDKLIVEERRFTLPRASLENCLKEETCVRRTGTVDEAGSFNDDDFYQLSFGKNSLPACLVADVRAERNGDTVIALMDLNREVLDDKSVDDDSGVGLGSRLIYPIANGSDDRLLFVGAYDDLAEYTLFVALTPMKEGGGCPSPEDVTIPGDASPTGETEPAEDGPTESAPAEGGPAEEIVE